MWPPTSFRRELKNRLARYLVAYERVDDRPSEPTPAVNNPDHQESSLFVRLFSRIRYGRKEERVSNKEPVVGFVGVWYMADEAHITAISVRKTHRRRGVGELLLIGSIEQAMARRSRVVTLGVRASNHEAYSLYYKYGFRQAGLRKGYYTDNKEDAIIMTTSPIQVSPYPEQLRDLIMAHKDRWDESERVLF